MLLNRDQGQREPPRVLILCTGNSARSQMAEALLRARSGNRFEVYSAGVAPKGVHPLAVQVMAEMGIDISQARSKGVEEFLGQPMDYVITVCDNANETCPVFPGAVTRLHYSFEDPAAVTGDEAARLAVFRRVRDELDEWLQDFASHQ
ncbi:MAG: arsenate reductase ArsC [Anaerolineae bacterium]|nr:arsenate reductase ArsC [Anaerolineae bacterium]